MSSAVRMPVDLVRAPEVAGVQSRLGLVLSRLRATPAEPFRSDPEPSVRRVLEIPTEREFTLIGDARVSARASDDVLDATVGRPDRVRATSSDRLAGDRHASASAGFDGDPATAWSPGFLDQRGRWLEATSAQPVTFDALNMVVVRDGRHSVPTRVLVETDGAARVSVDLPAVTDDSSLEGATASLRVALPRMTASTVRITVEAVREVLTKDFYSGTDIAMPVAIAEVGVPGLTVDPLPAEVPAGCRDDLLRIDGAAVPIRVSLGTQDALDGDPGVVSTCDGAPIRLGAGRHLVETPAGQDTGIDIDRLALLSERGGGAAALGPSGGWEQAPVAASPKVGVTRSGQRSYRLAVADTSAPFWLVLGESENAGWVAKATGANLSDRRLVDGHANGWLVTPTGGDITISLDWTPQRVVWVGLAVSGVGTAVALLLLVWPRRRTTALDEPEPRLQVTLGQGTAPSWATTLLTGVGLGVVAFVVGGVVPGATVTVASLVALRWRAGRLATAVAPWLAFAPVALWYAAKQYHNGWSPGVEWPDAMNPAHTVVLTAMLLLGA
ncbi:MAG TPA: hypothetical protein VF855_04105, partial [Acidimicrobiales bacterium]